MTPIPVVTSPLVTDWILAWTTLLGAVGTVSAFFTAFVLMRREARRDLVHRQNERRSQARLVYGFITLDSGVGRITIVNDSDQPIYRVWVIRQRDLRDFYHLMIPGKKHISMDVDRAETEWFGVVASSYAHPVTFEFTDANSVSWRRTREGQLLELTTEGAYAPGEPPAPLR
ncbi:hypothetical protein [Streptomyces botrytidirepellens]|nr:hypothetical protein [Streptomyces botrytidirepellens]